MIRLVNQLLVLDKSEKMIIPKIFHQIWVGPHEIPKQFLVYSKTWQDLHPDWDYMLWTEKNIPTLINQEFYDKTNINSEKKDLWMYEAVYNYGGFYIDFDYECLMNMDKLLYGLDFIACKEADNHTTEFGAFYKQWFNSGLIAATPKHPLIKKLIDAIPVRYQLWDALSDEIKNKLICKCCWRTGPIFMSDILKDEKFTAQSREIFNGKYCEHHYTSSWKEEERRGIQL
jgi:mannosyltransferase OCH1-like enzyme